MLQSVELCVRKRHLVAANKIVGSLEFKHRALRVLGLLLQLFDTLLGNLAGEFGRCDFADNVGLHVGVDDRVNNICRLHGVFRRKTNRDDARHILPDDCQIANDVVEGDLLRIVAMFGRLVLRRLFRETQGLCGASKQAANV